MGKIVYDKELVELLANPIIDRNDLSFLIDIVLGTNEKYKLSIEKARLSIDKSTKIALNNIRNFGYYNRENLSLLVYEFQSLSSNSISNAVKKILSIDLLSYEKIKSHLFSEKQITEKNLTNLLKKLSSVEKSKRNQMILDYVDHDYKEYKKNEKKDVIKPTVLWSSVGASVLKVGSKIVGKGIPGALRNVNLPVAAAITAGTFAKSITDYNESVVFPFVIQIEWIKYCLKNNVYKRADLVLSQVEIDNKDGLPIKGCSVVDNDTFNTIKKNKISSNISSKLSSIFRESSNNQSNINRLTTEYVLIDVPYDSLANSKEINGAKRGFFHGADKKIKGHANFTKAGSATALVSSIFNLTSFAVGQYELAKIQSELKRINEKLDFLMQLTFSNDRAVIKNFIDNIRIAINMFLENTGDIDIELGHLENSKTKIEEIIAKYEEQCVLCFDELNKIENSIWGSNDITSKILEIQNRYKIFTDILKLAYLSIGYFGSCIQLVLRDENKKYHTYLNHIEFFLNGKLKNEEAIFAINRKIRERIKKSKSILSSKFQKSQTDLANFVSIDSAFEHCFSTVFSFENKIQKRMNNQFLPNDDVKLLGRINKERTLEDLYLVPEKDIIISEQ